MKPFLQVSMAEENTRVEFLRPVLAQIDFLSERIADNFNIPVNKIQVITKD